MKKIIAVLLFVLLGMACLRCGHEAAISVGKRGKREGPRNSIELRRR